MRSSTSLSLPPAVCPSQPNRSVSSGGVNRNIVQWRERCNCITGCYYISDVYLITVRAGAVRAAHSGSRGQRIDRLPSDTRGRGEPRQGRHRHCGVQQPLPGISHTPGSHRALPSSRGLDPLLLSPPPGLLSQEALSLGFQDPQTKSQQAGEAGLQGGGWSGVCGAPQQCQHHGGRDLSPHLPGGDRPGL